MAVETFTWSPLADPVGDTQFRVLKAQFGDGYSQVAQDGINNEVSNWPLSFSGYDSEMSPIIQFFKRHAGQKAFLWTPPLGVQGLYRVEGYSLQAGAAGTNYNVQATFMEVFRP